jgi:5-methylcytosine-specific restriction protein A
MKSKMRKALTLRKDPLTQTLFEAYQDTLRETGYCARRFVVALKRHGGLEVAKRILAKRGKAVLTSGILALKQARKPELSVEWIALMPEFRSQFSSEEQAIAAERIRMVFKVRPPMMIRNSELSAGDTPQSIDFKEGSVRRVSINRYERNKGARDACLRKYGWHCKVCEILLEHVYGEIGRNFIHVHHVKPIAMRQREYKFDPLKDLVPVCPNCHEMLHMRQPPFSIYELRQRLRARRKRRKRENLNSTVES